VSLHYLMGEIETGLEILFTGKTAGQYWKTAFILCDNYTELTVKLFLVTKVTGWTDLKPNGKFKSYHDILKDIEACTLFTASDLVGVKTLHVMLKARREQRNDFFHSANLLKLNVHFSDAIAAFCGLLEYGKLLFGTDWESGVNGRPVLCNLAILVRLEHKALTTDPTITSKVNTIFRDWRKNKQSVQAKGAFVTEFPEDVHRRMVIINGGVELRNKLIALL
jgi:hypothetical protein